MMTKNKKTKRHAKRKSKKNKDVFDLNKQMLNVAKNGGLLPGDIMVVSAAAYKDLLENVMGCDIHVILQFRKDGDYWDNINACNLGRDYSLFGYIAGVRGGDEPVVAPRGLPEDFTEYEKEDLRGEHSFTWLMPQEMQKAINLRLQDPESGVNMKLRYLNLLALRLEKDGYEVRYVIGFDS